MINLNKKLHTNLLNIYKQKLLQNYRVIIKLKPNSTNFIKKLSKNSNCTIIHLIEQLNIICLIISHKLLSNLIEYPEIQFISLDSEVLLCGNKTIAQDKTQDSQIITENSKLTGKNITVGLIDSGIYPFEIFTKPKNRITLFNDLINNFKYPYDDNGHGTAMCSIIGDKFFHKNTIIKNSYECNFNIIKAFDKYNKSYSSLIFKAFDILYKNCDENNLKVICITFELQEFNDFILKIFQYFFDKFSSKNIIILVPAGNNSSEYCSIKGLSLLNNCLTVGGTDFKYSSRGVTNNKLLKPTIISISENIYLSNINTKYVPERDNQYIYPTKYKNSYVEYFGTSTSCAYVSGLITLLKQKNNLININDCISLLKICCDKISNIDNSIQGLGIININKFLE